MAGKHRERSQQAEADQDARLDQVESDQYAQQAPPPPAPAAGGMNSGMIEQLKQLGELHEQGVLTDDEFAQQKARLLG
jgi:hypothetical protein